MTKLRSRSARRVTLLAALALLLAAEDARGINGQAINVDGGTVLY